MKKVIFGIGGIILGGLLGSITWALAAVFLKALFTLMLAAGGGYLGYQYAKRQETPSGRWGE